MTYRYLVKSQRHLVQLLACNLLPKGYVFYATSWLPADADAEAVDAKLILRYGAHYSKSKHYRRRKAGHATVRYLRCGRLCVLVATTGRSAFFEREAWRDARERPLCVGGYVLGVRRADGDVSVRIHREAQNRLRRTILRHARAGSAQWWERWIRRVPFLAFRGVQDNTYALVKFLNACRRDFRLPPVEWERCVRRFFKVEEVFLPTPPEVLEVLRWHEEGE